MHGQNHIKFLMRQTGRIILHNISNIRRLQTSFHFLHTDFSVFIYTINKPFIYVTCLHIKCRPHYTCNKYCLTLSNMWDNNIQIILQAESIIQYVQLLHSLVSSTIVLSLLFHGL